MSLDEPILFVPYDPGRYLISYLKQKENLHNPFNTSMHQKLSRASDIWLRQRQRNLGSFCASEFYLRIHQENLFNCPNPVRTVWTDDVCPDRLKNFQPISKLSKYFQLKLSRFFEMISHFPEDFKTVRIFPDDCQFSGRFQNCPDFSR